MATRLALLVVLLAWLSVCERAFGSSAIPPTTPASFVCPNCDLGERGKYGVSFHSEDQKGSLGIFDTEGMIDREGIY